MKIARLQDRIAEREKQLLAMQKRHDFIANTSIKAKYAQEIAEVKRDLKRMKRELECALVPA